MSMEELSLLTKVSYSFLRMPISAIDFLVRPARVSLYIETLGMGIHTQAMIISACKSVDFLLGFIVGYMSDKTNTKWGRRKPYIALLCPLYILCMLMLCNPPQSLGVERSQGVIHCMDLYNISTKNNCIELKQCIDENIMMGTLSNYTNTSNNNDMKLAGSGLSIYFAIFYFFFYATGWTGTVIPYDALGMELTDDYDERSRLFGIKSAFQFCGYLLQTGFAIYLSASFATNILYQVQVQSYALSSLTFIAVITLLKNVKERPVIQTHSNNQDVPIVVSVRRVMQNKPYMTYLLMRIPLTLASLLPSNLLAYYVKYVIRQENSNQEIAIVMGIAILSVFISIPLFVKGSIKFGKKNVLYSACLLEGYVFLIGFLIPTEYSSHVLMYVLAIFIGFGLASSFVVPDAILADIIDYDELLTGSRNEGIYTVVESNLQQFVEIIGGVLPGIILGYTGFVNNGGCECGCGVKCNSEFIRWNCPNDIGYACTSDFDSELLYGNKTREAPCTYMNNDSQWVVKTFFLVLPGIMFMMAAIPSFKMKISNQIHKQIIYEIQKRSEYGNSAIDPITRNIVATPADSERGLWVGHFSRSELYRFTGNGLIALKNCIVCKCLLWLSIIISCLVAMILTNGNETIVTIGCLMLAALFILFPWDLLKLRQILLNPYNF